MASGPVGRCAPGRWLQSLVRLFSSPLSPGKGETGNAKRSGQASRQGVISQHSKIPLLSTESRGPLAKSLISSTGDVAPADDMATALPASAGAGAGAGPRLGPRRAQDIAANCHGIVMDLGSSVSPGVSVPSACSRHSWPMPAKDRTVLASPARYCVSAIGGWVAFAALLLQRLLATSNQDLGAPSAHPVCAVPLCQTGSSVSDQR